MKLTFRWYGLRDSIPLRFIKQIPNMSGVVTSVYDVKAGELWPEASLAKLQEESLKAGLEMEVIESIPVVEDIKLGLPSKDHYIDIYAENIVRASKYGIKCVCYNFMPVFDWIRTDLTTTNPDGSKSLSYSTPELMKLDPKNLHLPGWDESYSPDELRSLLEKYKSVTHEQLLDNLAYFLNRLMPTLEKCDVNMAIHPDDPPWDVFKLPRIVSTEEDLDKLFSKVPSARNGLTLCIGSLGENPENDVVKMAGKYASQGRIHFAHLRNVRYLDDQGSFIEAGHMTKMGSLDMGKIVQALVDNGFTGYVRPDHGRSIWDEKGKPGYGLYDRALGCAYINGLFEIAEHNKRK